MSLRYFFCMVPFLFFIVGYVAVSYFFSYPMRVCPSLIGCSVVDALKEVSQRQLNMRIIDYKEDASVTGGIVLHQFPSATSVVRSFQTILVVVSQEPSGMVMPLLCSELIDEQKKIGAVQLGLQVYDIIAPYRSDYCFAQMPKQGAIIKDVPIVYRVSCKQKFLLFPNFLMKRFDDVVDFLDYHTVKWCVHHIVSVPLGHHCTGCYVVKQDPKPGTLVQIGGMPIVYLYVASN